MTITIAVGATLLIGAFYSWTNRINGMFFFGRSADADLRQSPEAKVITRQYLVAVVATTGVAALLAWAGGQLGGHFAAIGPLFAGLAFWAIFAKANRQVRTLQIAHGPIATGENIVQVPLLEPPSYSIPATSLALLPALLGAASFLVALLHTHHGADLRAAWNTWSASTDVHHLDMILGMSLGLLTTATALLLLFRSSARLRTNMAQYTIRASVVMQWVGLALLLAVLACNDLGVTLTAHTTRGLTIVGVIAVLATTLWNQGRSKRFVPPPVEMGADDRWRWGLFYIDRNDPALFVQSRCGAGYTLNYGRMLAWPIAAAIVAYFVLVVFMPAQF